MTCHPNGLYTLWQEAGHYLPPVYSHPWRYFGGLNETPGHVEYHHYYGLNPLFLRSASWNFYWQHPWPAVLSTSQVPAWPPPRGTHSWPEGASMKVDLKWGKLERVYGPRWDLPDFVKEDLRRVYGTYPRTRATITYRGGEFVVQGDPHVGKQEYKVEKKVVRQLESPHEDSMSMIMEGRKKAK